MDKDIRNYSFYKEPSTKWYIDYPEWPGSKSDLEMVSGADTMLEYMSEGEDKVTLSITTDPINHYDKLKLVERTPEAGGGYYLLSDYCGHSLNLKMWLCGVTEHVFNGHLPEEIYLKKIK